MTSRHRLSALGLAALALCAPSRARATDGHFLHGVGAINSAMGGLGVAASSSLLGALYSNPAGLLSFRGTTTELGFEMFKAERTLESRAGDFNGSTTSGSQYVPIPAFGWSREVRSQRLVVGVGGLGIGGFGVDYHVDATNPILMSRPNGFGQIYSNFSLMKIIPGAAWQATPKLRLGAALNVDWASLAVDPMAIAAPAVDPGPDATPGTADDRAYYSRATDASGAFGIGGQLGLQYLTENGIALGLAYTTPQRFQTFEFGSVYENPNLSNYNTARTIRFAMDVPAVYAAGIAWVPAPALTVGVDAKYITYSRTRGFSKSGFAPDGAVRGFGWKDIWSVATGFELWPNDHVAFRAGYNYSANPIPEALTMFNAPAPAIVRNHVTLGAGYKFGDLGVDVAWYRAFRNSITGPMQTMSGAAPGTSVTSTLSESSVLMGFTYNPLRR